MDDNNNIINESNNSILFTRFKQVLWGTQLALCLGCLSVLHGQNAQYVANLFVLGGIFLTNLLLLRLLARGNTEQAINLFLWILTLGASVLVWKNGGLRDSAALIFPVLLMFVSLFGKAKSFVAISLFMLSVIVSVGLNSLHGWVDNPLQPFSAGHIFDVLLVTALSGYVAWVFSSDMKKTLFQLRQENTRVKESQRLVQRLAHYDPLTGLLNRAACAERYERMLASRDGDELIVLYFLDLDNFKTINDTYNHSTGDELLVGIANRLRNLTQKDDLVCRLGGDEFLIILLRDGLFDSGDFASKLLQDIIRPYPICPTGLTITTSIGIALAPADGTDFDTVRKKADIAMYKSKMEGRNRYHYFSEDMNQEIQQRNRVITGISLALKEQGLELFFQPKVDMENHRIVGAEALLRWTVGNEQNVPPEHFISVIESTELIHEIGSWVMHEACVICKQWHEAGFVGISISVNVSSSQFGKGNLGSIVSSALEKSGLEPQFLEIELTEHLLLKNSASVLGQLEIIKNLGVMLAIDDFGTGYSNLSYLTRFNVDTLKLDRSFIAKMTYSQEHLVIVTAILGMAKVLGLTSIAEGVERLSEAALLHELGCDFGQGFFWSKPLPEAQFRALLSPDVGPVFRISPDTISPDTSVLTELPLPSCHLRSHPA